MCGGEINQELLGGDDITEIGYFNETAVLDRGKIINGCGTGTHDKNIFVITIIEVGGCACCWVAGGGVADTGVRMFTIPMILPSFFFEEGTEWRRIGFRLNFKIYAFTSIVKGVEWIVVTW